MKKHNIYFLVTVMFLYSGIIIHINHDNKNDIIKDTKGNVVYITDTKKSGMISRLGYAHFSMSLIFLISGIKEIRNNKKQET
jgi:hypothetical protein